MNTVALIDVYTQCQQAAPARTAQTDPLVSEMMVRLRRALHRCMSHLSVVSSGPILDNHGQDTSAAAMVSIATKLIVGGLLHVTDDRSPHGISFSLT